MSNIVIFGGAGASGRHLAAELKAAGHNITIVDTNVEALRKDGGNIIVTYKDSAPSIMSPLANAPKWVSFADGQLLTPAELKGIKLPADLVICVTKAFDLDANLAETIINSTNAKAPVLCLNNGVMPYALPEGVRLESIGDAHAFTDTLTATGRKIVGGVINFPATAKDGGVDVGVTRERVQEVGITIGKSDADPLISQLCTSAKLGCKKSERIDEVVFNKLGDILSLGLQALFDTTYVDAANPKTITGNLTEIALREHHAIAKAVGVDLGVVDDFVEKMQGVMQKKGAFKGSMHPDLKNGKRTEKEAIYRALGELAERYDVRSAVLDKIYKLLTVARTKDKLDAVREVLARVNFVDDFCNLKIGEGQKRESP